jgi:glycosyltransferase involved in cell wall biosynthesis
VSSKVPRVEIFQNTMTHYRVPVFARLAKSTRLTFRVCFGQDPAESDLHMPDGPLPFEASFTPMLRIAVPGRNPLWLQPEEIRAALGRDYDVLIHTADFHVLSYLVATFLAKFRRKKVIHWTHGTSRGGPRSRVKETIRRWIHKHADAVLLYGDREYEYYRRMGFPMERVFVTHNSLDTSGSRVLRESISESDLADFRSAHHLGHHLLIYTGRLLEEKRVDQVIRALPRIARLVPDVVLLLIGQGPELEKLSHLAKALGVDDRVRFTGPVYDEAVLARYFLCSSLAVCPGYVGLNVNHAFAYGVPVVTTDDYWLHSPEIAMVTPGKTGAFFRNNDTDSLAEVVVSVLSDDATLRAMSANCLSLVDTKYNEESVVAAFEAAVAYAMEH